MTATTADDRPRCRGCGVTELRSVLHYGNSPLGDVLLTEEQLSEPEPRFPLHLVVCAQCALLQLESLVPPEITIPEDYPYFISALPSLVEHFQSSAKAILASHDFAPDALVVEVASNDGTMLRTFRDHGLRVLGIDPAPRPADAAERAGVPTIREFFGSATAQRLADAGERARLLLANNVLDLVPEPGEFVEAMAMILDDDGTIVLEEPYAVELIDRCKYDMVFLQRPSYFTLTALDRLFRVHGLAVNDVERIGVLGGSLRVFASRRAERSANASELLDREAELGVSTSDYYDAFAQRARRSRDELVRLLRELRASGARIALYGAGGGMSTTLTTFAGIDGELVDFAVDTNPHKHGRYTPGSHLRIDPPSRLVEDRPDYVLLVAWTYAAEILAANTEYTRGGGRFIVPVPEPQVLA